MSFTERYRRTLAVGGVTVLAAAGGIAGALAAPSGKTSTTKAKSSQTTTNSTSSARDGHRHGPGGPGVHSESTVLNKAGDGFITVTSDKGEVISVDGNKITIKQAVGTVVYKESVDITIADGATVYRNGKTAKVSDLKKGDRVMIASSSEGTTVMAGDASFRPGHPGGRHGGRGHGGPPMMG